MGGNDATFRFPLGCVCVSGSDWAKGPIPRLRLVGGGGLDLHLRIFHRYLCYKVLLSTATIATTSTVISDAASNVFLYLAFAPWEAFMFYHDITMYTAMYAMGGEEDFFLGANNVNNSLNCLDTLHRHEMN